jgi:hypothetical protein
MDSWRSWWEARGRWNTYKSEAAGIDARVAEAGFDLRVSATDTIRAQRHGKGSPGSSR